MSHNAQSNSIVFQSNDVVLTRGSERDIEEIPAGTAIKLTRRCSDDMWWGHGKVKGVLRSLLVSEQNLEHAFK